MDLFKGQLFSRSLAWPEYCSYLATKHYSVARHSVQLLKHLMHLSCIQCTVSPSCPITVFGHVIDGFDTLDRMEKIPGDAKDRPKQEIKIERITIHANPMA